MWMGFKMTTENLGITSSYEEWLEEFIVINSDLSRGVSGYPLTRKEYYERYLGPDIEPRRIYERHLALMEELRSRGAITTEGD